MECSGTGRLNPKEAAVLTKGSHHYQWDAAGEVVKAESRLAEVVQKQPPHLPHPDSQLNRKTVPMLASLIREKAINRQAEKHSALLALVQMSAYSCSHWSKKCRQSHRPLPKTSSVGCLIQALTPSVVSSLSCWTGRYPFHL